MKKIFLLTLISIVSFSANALDLKCKNDKKSSVNRYDTVEVLVKSNERDEDIILVRVNGKSAYSSKVKKNRLIRFDDLYNIINDSSESFDYLIRISGEKSDIALARIDTFLLNGHIRFGNDLYTLKCSLDGVTIKE